MTTSVIVQAHCASNKEVHVVITDVAAAGEVVEEFKLQDGETATRVVYEGRAISVFEAVK